MAAGIVVSDVWEGMAGKKQDYRAKTAQDVEVTKILSIVALIGIGICVAYLSYEDNLYSVGQFWMSPVLIMLIVNELGKYQLFNLLFREDRTLNPRENVGLRKRKSFRSRIVDGIKFMGAMGMFLGIYAAICIALGAPALEKHEETFTLAGVLTILTIFPLVIFLGISGCLQFLWTETLDSVSKVDAAYVKLAKISAAGAIFGAWSGSIVAPLDWDRRWQVYPIPNIVGALLGYTLGDILVLCQQLISSIFPSFSLFP
uniref:Uncharacterized protein n=1 Tax=Phlebotomus papatasi TaxID=29031 RepID=A0A1B0D0H2_PHLPP